ncbi:hypothetical protein SAMN05428989_3818 [Pseudoxanthomonas sp. GM95]|uniref:sel1 repeat family protein n=1 Tax=Pseudoxanthomonas sp. GM95 TaxID=1881043 RepID=UPI0008AE84C7|nr:sel1 repeat family protein [Pseudoxanthomonas sp. GM95]SEM42477.1 hypothetical protein SAMN05428989_3818 [Pseudoxanthomonas sp. GM95]
MRIKKGIIGLSLVLAATGFTATADAASKKATFYDVPADVMTDGFFQGHLDLFYRRAGMRADKDRDFSEARKQYRLAARYADKPSQARLGEMYWNGEGGTQDRVMGFLFMALAAERGYESFTAHKMDYWRQLTEDERKRAVRQDKKMLADYGDEVAKPRWEAVLKREARRSTGSLLGGTGASALVINSPRGGGIDAQRFYAPQFWQPTQYWSMQDRLWAKENPGIVTVGDVEGIPLEVPEDHSAPNSAPANP